MWPGLGKELDQMASGGSIQPQVFYDLSDNVVIKISQFGEKVEVEYEYGF